MKGITMICQHGTNTKEYICPKCEAEIERYHKMNVTGAYTKEHNEKAIALLLEQQENDRIFGNRFR